MVTYSEILVKSYKFFWTHVYLNSAFHWNCVMVLGSKKTITTGLPDWKSSLMTSVAVLIQHKCDGQTDWPTASATLCIALCSKKKVVDRSRRNLQGWERDWAKAPSRAYFWVCYIHTASARAMKIVHCTSVGGRMTQEQGLSVSNIYRLPTYTHNV